MLYSGQITTFQIRWSILHGHFSHIFISFSKSIDNTYHVKFFSWKDPYTYMKLSEGEVFPKITFSNPFASHLSYSSTLQKQYSHGFFIILFVFKAITSEAKFRSIYISAVRGASFKARERKRCVCRNCLQSYIHIIWWWVFFIYVTRLHKYRYQLRTIRL